MDAPPIRYVSTSDGYEIAYTVAGQGLPFVFMPWPFNNVARIWHTAFGRPMLRALAERFLLVQYDSRGQGMSTRGLPEDHAYEDYETDLAAVVDRLELEAFVLYGAVNFGQAAVGYTLKHPERVKALVLGDITVAPSSWISAAEELARRDWNTFLHVFVSGFSLDGAPPEMPYWRDAITREDWLRMSNCPRQASLAVLLPAIRVPTLLLSSQRLRPDEPVNELGEQGQLVASLVPDCRLLAFDAFGGGWYSKGAEPPPAVLAIEQFTRDAGVLPKPAVGGDAPAAQAGRLSPREVEVLRLIASGRSNQEIAAELVLSVRTVERHISNVYGKIGARRKADATAYALRHGLA